MILRKYALLLILLLIESNLLLGQGIAISGTVSDFETDEMLPGVNVMADGKIGTSTNKDGGWMLRLVPGRHEISFSFVGYARRTMVINIKGAKPKQLNIQLKQTAVNLNTAVVSAGRYRQKLADITLSMAVIKPDLIQNTNTLRMETAVNRIPGVNVLDGQASIRGGGGYSYGAGSRVLLLEDDLPLLSADASQIKWNFLPIEIIDQVEILKGAASALYGSSALNGVINIRTRWPGLQPKTSLLTYAGVYNKPTNTAMSWWWKRLPLMSGIRFSHSQKIRQTDLVFGFDALNDEGYREDNFEKHLRFNLKLRHRSKKVKGLSYGLNNNLQWQYTSDFFIWQNADSGAYLQMPNTAAPTHAFRFHSDPWITYFDVHNYSHSLRMRYYKVQNQFATNPDKNSGSELYYGQYLFHAKFVKKLNVSAGFSASYGVTRAALYGNHQSNNLALFIQSDYQWTKALSLSAGFRWEDYRLDISDHESAPVFRAGLNYHLASFTFLRASLGQGFRFPSVAEKYTATSLGSVNVFPNPLLKPEKGWSGEVGIKQGFKIKNWTGMLDVAAFWTEYHDMIEFTFGLYKPDSVVIPSIHDLGFKSLNIGKAKIQGVEINLQGMGHLGDDVSVKAFAGYTYKHPVDLSLPDTVANKILKYRYRHSAKADVALQYKQIEVGMSVRYHSFMERIDQAFEDKILGVEMFPGLKDYRLDHQQGSTVVDFRMAFRFRTRIKISFIANNLLNAENMGRPGDLRPPRTLLLQLRYDL
jgi:iron complex outermembrane receptor protein